MTIRLVVTDVDGTLVRNDKTLAPSTVQAVSRLQQAGVPVAIVSARPPFGMRWLQDALALTGPLAGFNGGCVVGPDGQVVSACNLPEAAARIALRLFAERGISAWLFTASEWMIVDASGPKLDLERMTVRQDEHLVDSFEPYMGQIGKITGVSDDHALLEAVEGELQGMLGAAANAKRSQAYYLDVTHPEANKGNAVRLLAEAAGVGVDEVAVLGDMMNDVPMFAVAGFSVAMGNASDEVKRLAAATTASNEHDGWAEAVDRLILPRTTRSAA